jgi:RNA binding exosome subunit
VLEAKMAEERTEADDVVEEVRQIRREIWAQFDNDPDKLIAYYTELDKQYADHGIASSEADKQDKSAT